MTDEGIGRIAVGHDRSGRPYAVRLPAPDATAGDGLEWLYNEASGVLYGPDPEHPRLRYPVAAEVPPLYGHRLAAAMNASAPDATAGDGLREAIARRLAETQRRHVRLISGVSHWDLLSSSERHSLMVDADAVLALPALRDVLAEQDRLREFAEWVLSLADDPPHRQTVTLEQIIQRAAVACDPALDGA